MHAIRLSSPLEWTAAMQAELRRSLAHYRRKTPAWPSVQKDVASLSTERARLEERQRRLTASIALDQRYARLAAALGRGR